MDEQGKTKKQKTHQHRQLCGGFQRERDVEGGIKDKGISHMWGKGIWLCVVGTQHPVQRVCHRMNERNANSSS